MDPMENSHRRNMALFDKANKKPEGPAGMGLNLASQAEDAFKKLNAQIKAGMIPKL